MDKSTKQSLNIEITGSTKREISYSGSKQKVYYKITVRSEISEWNLEYRFSHFREFHKKLLRSHPKKLPELPSRLNLLKKEEQVREERQHQLQIYLNKICSKDFVLEDIDCITFFRIPDDIKNMLKDDKKRWEQQSEELSDSSFEEGEELDCEVLVKQFLERMNKREAQQLQIVQKFEKKIFSNKIRSISEYTMRRLFNGDSNNGLLNLIREQKQSYLAASHVISLVAKLLDCEKNVFAKNFKKTFAEYDLATIKGLKLEQQIQYQMLNEVNDGLFIIDCYLQTCQENGQRISISDILRKPELIKGYEQWKEKTNPVSEHNLGRMTILKQQESNSNRVKGPLTKSQLESYREPDLLTTYEENKMMRSTELRCNDDLYDVNSSDEDFNPFAPPLQKFKSELPSKSTKSVSRTSGNFKKMKFMSRKSQIDSAKPPLIEVSKAEDRSSFENQSDVTASGSAKGNKQNLQIPM